MFLDSPKVDNSKRVAHDQSGCNRGWRTPAGSVASGRVSFFLGALSRPVAKAGLGRANAEDHQKKNTHTSPPPNPPSPPPPLPHTPTPHPPNNEQKKKGSV